MTKITIVAKNWTKFRVTTFLASTLRKTCSRTQWPSTRTYPRRSLSRTFFCTRKTPACLSRLRPLSSSPNLSSTLLADAIESIARKNIASALRTGASAPKGVFAWTVITNLWRSDWKWMWSNFGNPRTCSNLLGENVEHLMF